jgi:hypothetical protein
MRHVHLRAGSNLALFCAAVFCDAAVRFVRFRSPQESSWSNPASATAVASTDTSSSAAAVTVANESSEQQPAAVVAAASPWQEYKTEEGVPYFYNSVTGETSWTNPV